MPAPAADPARRAGFTLLELLVALALFSLGAMALLNMAGENARAAVALERRALAGIVVENLAAEVMLQPDWPELGDARGEAALAERRWRWERRTIETADARLRRIELDVREADAEQVSASLVLFRGP